MIERGEKTGYNERKKDKWIILSRISPPRKHIWWWSLEYHPLTLPSIDLTPPESQKPSAHP